MKYVVLTPENFVAYTFPEADPLRPDTPIEQLYSPDFLAACIKVEDNVEVQVGYKKTDAGFEPVPAPDPVPITIEDYRTQALERIGGKCSAAIYAGVSINGKHYSFTQTAQGNIKGMLIEIQNGKTVFLYCADNEPLTTYTADEIKAIAQVMGEWISVNAVYYEQLKIWINRETDEVVLSTIHYGSQLPNDLMQELVAKLASVGVDITKYASMLEG